MRKIRILLTIAVVAFFNLCFCFVSAAENIDYFVGVYYYPWYYNDFHGGHYLRKHLVPPQQPDLGEYNDRTDSVINTHIEWSLEAGIDFWATSWWGPGTREDETLLDHILRNANLGNLKIAIMYETVGRTNDFQDYSVFGTDISYLAAHYFSHPNYLKINGKPVIFVYLTRVLSSYGTLGNSISSMRQAALNAGYELYVVGDQVFGSPPASAGDISLLDAITNYDVYGSMGATGYAGLPAVTAYYSEQAQWKMLAKSVGTDFIPAATPGFNDNPVRPGHEPLSRKLTQDAEFGSLFKQMLQGAKTVTDPDINHMILVTSWNEWHEDTQIEPANYASPTSIDDSTTGSDFTGGLSYEGYGMRYLDILREETCPKSPESLMPTTVIRVNGQRGAFLIDSSTKYISLSCQMNTDGNYSNADWWLIKVAPDGTISHFDLTGGTLAWQPGLSTTYQGKLVDFPDSPIINISTLSISPGKYTFFFGVDTIMNGQVDINQLVYNYVTVEN